MDRCRRYYCIYIFSLSRWMIRSLREAEVIRPRAATAVTWSSETFPSLAYPPESCTGHNAAIEHVTRIRSLPAIFPYVLSQGEEEYVSQRQGGILKVLVKGLAKHDVTLPPRVPVLCSFSNSPALRVLLLCLATPCPPAVQPPLCLSVELTVAQVAKRMAEVRTDAVILLGQQGDMKGILTDHDVARYNASSLVRFD